MFDHRDQFVASVAVCPGEVDELVDAPQDSAALGCAGDGDSAPAAELEQSLVAQCAQGPQNGVGVDIQHRREVFGERESVAGGCLTVSDPSADLGRDLEIERGGLGRVDLALVRLGDGRFRVVAGDGTSGFSGDGGSALGAKLSTVSELAFSPAGSLYVVDGGRVRVISPEGVIDTVAGDGQNTGKAERRKLFQPRTRP